MKIMDPIVDKEREVKDLKVVNYEDAKSVEFTVIGKTREWKGFIPYADFVAANKDVNLEGGEA